MANSQIEPWNNLWADLSQGMANSKMEPWNNLWADLSQGMANSQMEPWNNLWTDLSQNTARYWQFMNQNRTNWNTSGSLSLPISTSSKSASELIKRKKNFMDYLRTKNYHQNMFNLKQVS